MKVKFNVTKLENGDVVATSELLGCFMIEDDPLTKDKIECWLTQGYGYCKNTQLDYFDQTEYDGYENLYGKSLSAGVWYSVYQNEKTGDVTVTECHHSHTKQS